VCLVPEDASAEREQAIVRRLPAGGFDQPAGSDPTRLFPGMQHEYVAVLPGTSSGSTLHVASDDEDLGDPSSPAAHFAERASAVLGRSLAMARAIEGRGREGIARPVDQRLLQADKLAQFGQIAAGVVHELNNPLTSIVAYSEYLTRKAAALGTRADPDDVERLRRISESASRMLHFTRDLVSYARPSTGIAGPVVLHSMIDQAIAFCEHVLSAAGVRVERRYGTEVLTIRAVGEQIVQVFVNLLTNASQAAPPRDGCVVITTELAEVDGARLASVTVEDNGSGIAPQHLPHVFVPFFTTKGDRHGTGLGLSIVKSILESHGGAVRVDSQLGRGTRFVLGLPVWSRG
jgi:signal transduction histidine kinase